MAKTSSPDPYLLRESGHWRWQVTSMLLRLPRFMVPLGFVVIGGAAASRNVGGLMVTAEVLLSMAGAPVLGRLVDRCGPRKMLPLLAYGTLPVLAAMAAVVAARGPSAALILCAALIGLLSAPRPGGMRALLAQTVSSSALRAALALNATLSEVAVLASPLLVGAAAVVSPVAILAVMAGATLVGGVLITRLPARAGKAQGSTLQPVQRNARGRALLSNRAIWFWFALYVAFGQLFGTVETGSLSWAQSVHAGTGGAAVALALLSAGGIGSSFAYLRLLGRFAFQPRVAALGLLSVMVAGCLGMALSRTWLVGALSMAAIGTAAVPLIAISTHAAGESMPEDRQAEGFGVLGATQSAAYALGGILLALLPLHWMLLAGTATGVLTLALSPVWLRSASVG